MHPRGRHYWCPAGVSKAQLCPHGILGRSKCLVCRRATFARSYIKHREERRRKAREKYVKDPKRFYDKAKNRAGMRRWRANNPSRAYETGRVYRLEHPEHERLRHAEHYAKNKTRILARRKERAALLQAYWRKYRKDHPVERAVSNANRRARMRGNGGSHTAQEWLECVRRHGSKCVYCGRGDLKLTRDHIVPLSRGGTNDISNIVPACRSCNSRKHDMELARVI